MSKLTLLALVDGYGVAESPQILYAALDGGMGRYRLDMVGGASREVSVSFMCDATEFDYLRTFIRTNIAEDYIPFEIDLITSDDSIVEHSASLIKDSFEFNGLNGTIYSCSARLHAVPLPGESTTWPTAGDDFVLMIPPQKASYKVQYGSDALETRLASPISKYRRSYFNAACLVTVKWLGVAADYQYLQEAYRAWVFSGGKPFDIELILNSSTPSVHKACFMPDSIKASQEGLSYTINVMLEVEPDDWTGDFTQHPSEFVDPENPWNSANELVATPLGTPHNITFTASDYDAEISYVLP